MHKLGIHMRAVVILNEDDSDDDMMRFKNNEKPRDHDFSSFSPFGHRFTTFRPRDHDFSTFSPFGHRFTTFHTTIIVEIAIQNSL